MLRLFKRRHDMPDTQATEHPPTSARMTPATHLPSAPEPPCRTKQERLANRKVHRTERAKAKWRKAKNQSHKAWKRKTKKHTSR